MELDELRNYLKSLPVLADKENSAKRKAKALKSFKAFVDIYFPHQVDFRKAETSAFRNFLYKDLTKLTKKEKKLLFEAYRGSAKTTIITRLFTIYALLVLGYKYAVIISSTIDIAKESCENIKTELEDNQTLIIDFGIELGFTWTSEEIVFKVDGNMRKLKVFGAGKKIRGTNFLGSRPDLIICDDIENDENVQSKAQRDKLFNWFFKAILKLPGLKNTNALFLVVGTRLHHDGLLARLSALDSFKNFNFPLIKVFPACFDELTPQNYKKLDISDMVLDDESIEKTKVLELFFENKESFYSEYQNEPLSRDGAIFAGFKTFDVMPKCEKYFIGVDPALGKTKGDYFAITILGLKDKTYYASSFGYKIKPQMMIEKIIKLYLKYFAHSPQIAIEVQQFQEFFKDSLKTHAKAKGLMLPIKPLRNTVSKELRIDSLSPYVTDGDILIDVNSHLLIEELDTYPKAPHDDLLDSLEMAFRIASSAGAADYRAINRLMKKNASKFQALRERL